MPFSNLVNCWENSQSKSAAKPDLTAGRFNDYHVGSKHEASETQDTCSCRVCGTSKPISDFYFRKDNGKARSECKECTNELHRLKKYGVCNTKYDEMLVSQKGSCAICNTKLNSSRYTKLAVDHDHRSGEVRGLLCTNCNTAIGLMKDSPKRLEQAAKYLKRFTCEDIV